MSEEPLKLSRFPGGLNLAGSKLDSTEDPITVCPLPAEIVLPVGQHIGTPGQPAVAVGDYVRKGQIVARPAGYISAAVHATTSGTVTDIAERPVPHPSGISAKCIVIEPDGQDVFVEDTEPIVDILSVEPARLRALIREAGIVGLGGATFPTSVKLDAASQSGLQQLVLNGAECEPYISCDQALMRQDAEAIVFGAEALMHALQVSRCIIAIERDVPEAQKALEEALHAAADPRITLTTVPTVYPAGGEKQLLQVLTGQEVPHDGLPADIGCICQNVGTAAAVANMIRTGEPLMSRIVTVTGQGVANPGNVRVYLGTPIADVVAARGGYTDDAERLIVGGPMMGFALETDIAPVTKATNCILVAGKAEVRTGGDEMPCIRCGDCASVCPASLLPQQLFWHIRSGNFDAVADHHLFDCIECGCCDFVCPSHIPLVQNFRYAKTEIWSRERESEKSNAARRRFEARSRRLEEQKAERRARLDAKKSKVSANADKDARKAVIDDVLKRVDSRDSSSSPPDEG